MGLFSFITVLLLEQIWPLPYRLIIQEPLTRLARFVESFLNAGERSYGLIAWLIAVGGLVLFAGGVYALLYSFSPLLAGLWNILVLYLTMGFRQFSDYYLAIQQALRMDDLAQARRFLADWREQSSEDISSPEIARLAIEQALRVSHQHVFGVLICFLLLPGPCGAVLYRSAAFFSHMWGKRTDTDVGTFGRFSQQAFAFIDWLPSRFTAIGFAIVGNFEDALYCWRTQADIAPDSPSGNGVGIVLASGSGAMGLRLCNEAAGDNESAERTAAGVDAMQSTIGLLWRALILWLLVLLLLWIAGLLRS